MEKNSRYGESSMKMNSETIKKIANAAGADLVGIGNPDLFDGTPMDKDPRYIFPGTKSVIGLGLRVLRGTLRGNEEGTQFFQYPEVSVVHLDEIHIPLILRRVACAIEDAGYEAVVQRAESDRLKVSDPSTNPEHTPVQRYSAIPVEEGKPAPDVIMDFNQAAVICGMGEIGYGGFVLTEEFGPLQRFGYILTDLELDFDDVKAAAICDKCRGCMTACPGNAWDGVAEEVKTIGDNCYECKTADSWQCAAYYMGASGEKNPFLNPDALNGIPDKDLILRGKKKLSPEEVALIQPLLEDAYPGMRFGYNSALCGRACWRECLVNLEKRGILKNKFKLPFRRREEWKLDI